jgi:hypothetical protein
MVDQRTAGAVGLRSEEGRIAMKESAITNEKLSAEKFFGMKIFGGAASTTGAAAAERALTLSRNALGSPE